MKQHAQKLVVCSAKLNINLSLQSKHIYQFWSVIGFDKHNLVCNSNLSNNLGFLKGFIFKIWFGAYTLVLDFGLEHKPVKMFLVYTKN